MNNVKSVVVHLSTLLLSLILAPALYAQDLTVTLTGSMHNGSGVPCFGKKEGAVTSSVSGGIPPYYYTWSNDETTANITGVAAGYYALDVKDSNGALGKASITLTEPEALKLKLITSDFPNGHNISCFECNNGAIQAIGQHGTPPYTYSWADGPSTAASRSGLGPREYQVTVTDANGCEEKVNQTISQPERSDWTMAGNAGTNPATQYIGTSDNTDVVFKANGQEALRLKGNGDISLMGSLTGDGPLYRREDGLLGSGFPVYPERPAERCHFLGSYPYWETRGNAFHQLCPDQDPLLGTLGERPLKMVTNGTERMRITTEGSVGIGTTMPQAKLHVQGDLLLHTPHGSIISTASATLGTALWVRNNYAAWGLSIDPTGTGHILGDLNDPHPIMSFSNDRVGIGTTAPSNVLTVSGDVGRPGIDLENTSSGSSISSELRFMKDGEQRWAIGSDFGMNGSQEIYFWDHLAVDSPEDAPGRVRMRIDPAGRVIIGDVDGREGYRLVVQEGILTERVKVALKGSNEWSDHVFQPGYRLLPLKDVAAFIKEHGHLPGVPSADQMVERGLDVVKTDAMLLEKIEEITLHLIGMEKRVAELERENATLKTHLNKSSLDH